MKLQEKYRKRASSAVLLILLGLIAVYQSFDYNIGTAARMGPGYFPLMLGFLLLLLAGLVFISPDESEEQAPVEHKAKAELWRRRARPWVAIVGSMLLFIVLGKWGGLVPATFVMILVAALGDAKNTLKSAFFLAAGVTAAAVAVFHYGLQLQFPLFNWG